MGELVNLNRVRKNRARAERAAQAAENRIRYGLPKAETERERLAREREDRAHEGHKREE